MPTPKRNTRRKKKTAPEPRGFEAAQLASGAPPAAVQKLSDEIARDGGSMLGAYRDPLGGHWQVLAGLPLEKVEPTPYQRDLSETHVARLSSAIERLGRFLDPVIAIRTEDGRYWTPNGHHRVAALRALGARSIVALVVPEPEVAHRILLLNTEKAHNLRERGFGGQQSKNMNVIGRTVDEQSRSAKLPDNTAQVRKQARLEFRVQQRCAVLRPENYVEQQVGVGVSHDSIAPPGLDVLNLGTHGSRRGLPSHGAPRLPHAQAHSMPPPESATLESARDFG